MSGIVDAVNDDGTYSICFDNGEKEEHVSRALIQTTIEDSLWSREWSTDSFPSLKDVVAYYYRRFKHSESYSKWKIHWSTVQAEKVKMLCEALRELAVIFIFATILLHEN